MLVYFVFYGYKLLFAGYCERNFITNISHQRQPESCL